MSLPACHPRKRGDSGSRSRARGDPLGSRRGSLIDDLSVKKGFVERQYSHILDYPIDFLSDMLTLPRSTCNRKFELCIDELVFIGHPVSVGKDGIWSFPDDEDELENPPLRGRRMREAGHPLHTVIEGKEVTNRLVSNGKTASPAGDSVPALTSFHFVIILDKPDPLPGANVIEGVSSLSLFDEIYREISLKCTAALYALQVRDNFVSKQVAEMGRLREKCLNDGEAHCIRATSHPQESRCRTRLELLNPASRSTARYRTCSPRSISSRSATSIPCTLICP